MNLNGIQDSISQITIYLPTNVNEGIYNGTYYTTNLDNIINEEPIFMGGKIVAYNKITQYAEQLAESQHATGMQDNILNTDQAYWQVISLINKKKLAQSYLQLVSQLDSDVAVSYTHLNSA